MINVYIPRFLSLFFSFSLLIGPLPLSAIIEDITISLSDWQANIVSNNPDESYVYQDFIFAERDTIIQILEYAAIVLQKKYNQLNNADTEQIIADLDEIIDTITNGSL